MYFSFPFDFYILRIQKIPSKHCTKNILSTSGPDDNLSAHRRDPNFDAGVPVLRQLSGQNLIKLREEDSIGHELLANAQHQSSNTRVQIQKKKLRRD